MELRNGAKAVYTDRRTAGSLSLCSGWRAKPATRIRILSTSPPDPEIRPSSHGEWIQSVISNRMPLCEQFGVKDTQ